MRLWTTHLGREEKSLYNEEMRKGDTLLDTYTVEADAISGSIRGFLQNAKSCNIQL